MAETASGWGCELWKASSGGLEHQPHMTASIGSSSLVPYHGATGLQYVGWSNHCRVRIKPRACMEGGNFRSDGSISLQRDMQGFRQWVSSSSLRNRRQICDSWSRGDSRRGSGIIAGMARGRQTERFPSVQGWEASGVRSNGRWERQYRSGSGRPECG